MAAKKGKSKKSKKGLIVKLVPKSDKESGKKISCFYTTKKNPKMEGGDGGKITKKMYNWVKRVHEVFVETKIK